MVARRFTRLLGAIVLVAAALGCVAAADPSTLRPGAWSLVFLGMIVLAALTGVVLWTTGHRWPQWALAAASTLMGGCVVVSVWVQQDRDGGLLNLMLLVPPVLWAAATLDARLARLQVGVLLVGTAVLMWAVADTHLQWVSLTLLPTVALLGADEAVVALRASQQRLLGELREAARRDPLTGLLNRRGLIEELAGAPAVSAVLMLDVDHFKQLNDDRGHAEGDRALSALAAELRVRFPAAVMARTGGEEFVVLCTDPRLAGSSDAARAVHRAADQALATWGCTVSVGAVPVGRRVAHADELDGLLSAADRALYRAKRDGRDQVVVADPEPHGDVPAPRHGPR